MATFPLLSSGALAQYPLEVHTGQGVEAIRFLDGSDQRYLTQGTVLRRWKIQLQLLNEFEAAQLEEFFIEQQGDFAPFAFVDPLSGQTVPYCRFASPGMSISYNDVDRAGATLWVLECHA